MPRPVRTRFWSTKSPLIRLSPCITPLSSVEDTVILEPCFSTVRKLLQPTKPFPLTPSTALCSEFLYFFSNKISTIYRQLQSRPVSTWSDGTCLPTTHPQSFSAFSAIDENTAHDLVTKARPTTCLLDPIPSPLVKASLPALCLLLTRIINTSLHAGVVPCSSSHHAYIKKY